MTPQKKPRQEMVENPDYVEDKCAQCGQQKCEHFEVITPRGIQLLCGTWHTYEEMRAYIWR